MKSNLRSGTFFLILLSIAIYFISATVLAQEPDEAHNVFLP